MVQDKEKQRFSYNSFREDRKSSARYTALGNTNLLTDWNLDNNLMPIA